MKPGKLNVWLRSAIGLLIFFQIYSLCHYQCSRIIWNLERGYQLGFEDKHEKLMRLCLTPDEMHKLIWMKKHEFIFQGEWYDVEERTTFADGSHEMLVYHDKKDKKLLAAHYTSSNDENQPQNVSSLHFKFPDLLTFMDQQELRSSEAKPMPRTFIYKENKTEPFSGVIKHPPKAAQLS